MDSLKQRALRGGFAKIVGQGVNILLRVAGLAVLARLLSPSDFGIVAMVAAIGSFFEIMTAAGLTWAAVQSASITNEQRSNLFWINVALGAGLALACAAMAPLLASFYDEPRLYTMTPLYAVGFLLSGLGAQHWALLERQLRYASVTYIEVGAQVAYVVVSVALAWLGFGFWALVWGSVAQSATTAGSAWIVTRWIPRLPRRDAQIGPFIRFGATLTLNNIIVCIAYNIEKILLGRFWGAAALGAYGRAYQLINLPVSSINAAVGGVTLSSLSRLQGEPARHRNYFLKGYAILMSLTLPTTAFCAVFGDDIVLLMLGSQWTDSVAVFRLLTPTVLFFGVVNPLQGLMLSLGLQRRSLYLSMVIAPLLICAVTLGIPYGPNGVAFSFSAALSLWLVPHVVWSLHKTNITPLDLASVVAKPMLAAIVAGFAGLLAHRYLAGLGWSVLRLALGGAIMALVYFGVLLFALGQRAMYVELLNGFRNAAQPAEGTSAGPG